MKPRGADTFGDPSVRLISWWPGEEQDAGGRPPWRGPLPPGKWSVQGGRSEQAGARHVFLCQRTLRNGKRAGDGAGLTAARAAAAVAVLSLRRGARIGAGLPSGLLGGARHREAAGMVGERREVEVGGG